MFSKRIWYNTFQLAEQIYVINVPDGARFASLDITNIYTNIPIVETIEIIKNNLMKHKIMNSEETVEFITLLEGTLAFNYFMCNGKIYFQKDGLTMGNSLSGTITDNFVSHREIISGFVSKNINTKIAYYKRYVNYTLLHFNGSKEEIGDLTSNLNSSHPN